MLSISTKTGDAGETSLANGQRVAKDHPVFEVIGTLDEVNSWLGLVAAKLGESFQSHKMFLYHIQDTLFYIGAELARSPKARLTQTELTKLEKEAEALQASLADDWHTQFLLPGGTELGGYLDVARTVCRRCERLLVAYAKSRAQAGEDEVSPMLMKYVNRLSDYVYLLRCFVNHQEQYREQKFKVRR